MQISVSEIEFHAVKYYKCSGPWFCAKNAFCYASKWLLDLD